MERFELIYSDGNVKKEIATMIADHFPSVDEMIDINDIDMDKIAADEGWDGWDYGSLDVKIITE